MKFCPKCETPKQETEFWKDRTRFDGLGSWCKQCSREARDATRVRNRNSSLLLKHNITSEIYDKILASQKGGCAVCKSLDPKNPWGVFCVDHNHACCPSSRSCGLCIRGLLCLKCNAALGQAEDNVGVLKSLIDYLIGHPLPEDLVELKEELRIRKKQEESVNRSKAQKGTTRKLSKPRKTPPLTEDHKQNIRNALLSFHEQKRANRK